MKTGFGNDQPAGQWNGQACPEGRGGGEPGVAGARGGALPGGGGGGRGRGEQTPEQKAAADAERKWRLGLSMDIFKELRKLYNDAGVSIYAVKDVRQDYGRGPRLHIYRGQNVGREPRDARTADRSQCPGDFPANGRVGAQI